MQGILATQKELGVVEKQWLNVVERKAFTRQHPPKWREKLSFWKEKYGLFIRLLELSDAHDKAKCKKEDLEELLRECHLFTNGTLPNFENKYQESYDLLKSLPESKHQNQFKRMNHLQKDWDELQKRDRQLELKLLHTLIMRFPVFIV